MLGPLAHLRATARTLTSAATGPHGYTLTVWGSGMVTAHRLGMPDLARVLLFAGAAALAFGLVHLAGRPGDAAPAVSLAGLPDLGGLQVVPVLLAIGSADGVAHVTRAATAWALTGAAATLVYWALAATTVHVALRRA